MSLIVLRQRPIGRGEGLAMRFVAMVFRGGGMLVKLMRIETRGKSVRVGERYITVDDPRVMLLSFDAVIEGDVEIL